MRTLVPHPAPGAKVDPWDTAQAAADFHITRLEWSYGLTVDFVAKLAAMGITVGGAIEDDPGSRTKLGRVTGKDGALVTHKWFPKDRLVGCANAPEFRAAWLEEAKRSVTAGAKGMQQDDPQMALRTDPPLCYCAYCQKAFALWQAEHGDDYAQFQRESVLAFHREMHQALDAWAGRHVPFSHNSTIGFSGKLDFTAPAFDFVNAEIEGRFTQPAKFLSLVQAAGGMPLVFTHRSPSLEENRHFFALTYATGTWMMCPWDVYMPGGAPRYFGKPEEYADLTGFVRANAALLDGYESAGVAEVSGGTGKVTALVRVRTGKPQSPVVVHVLEFSEQPQMFRVRVPAVVLGWEPVKAELRLPKMWASIAHLQAQETKDFSGLTQRQTLVVQREGNSWTISMPALHLWGILVLSRE